MKEILWLLEQTGASTNIRSALLKLNVNHWLIKIIKVRENFIFYG
jgi:hypothetical protein